MTSNQNTGNRDQNSNYRVTLTIQRVLAYAFLIFVTVLSLFSFLILIVNATRSNSEIQTGFSLIPSTHIIDNFNAALTSSTNNILRGMLNSFIIAVSCALLTTYFSAMTAYGIHVYDFRGKKFAFTFILAVMMIPTQVTAAGFIQIVRNLNLNNTYWPLIVPAVAAPAVFFYMKQYIESSVPLEVIEAARVDGSNEFRTFNAIALPMMKPAIAVQLIFAFVASWNNYFLPQMVIDKSEFRTVPIIMQFLYQDIQSQYCDYGKIYMTICLSVIPVVIVYLCLSKYIVKGVALGAVKG